MEVSNLHGKWTFGVFVYWEWGYFPYLSILIVPGLLKFSTYMEILTSIKRAGADVILSYFAKDFAKR